MVHVWTFRGQRIALPIKPDELQCDDGDATVFRSYFPPDLLPRDPTGTWSCETYTLGGQLVGLRKFAVVADAMSPPPAQPATTSPRTDGATGTGDEDRDRSHRPEGAILK